MIFFYPRMSSSLGSQNETRFSRSFFIIILLNILVMLADRVLYKLRRIDLLNTPEAISDNNSAVYKLALHVSLTLSKKHACLPTHLMSSLTSPP